MNSVVKILMERDGMTKEDAIALISETREEILMNQNEAEEIMMDNLGLEMDFIFDVL